MVENPISKSQRKREMHALQAMGAKLVELNQTQLAKMPISERLRAAIIEMKRLTSHEAKRRQLQFIGRLMRAEDIEPIAAELQIISHDNIQAKKDLHLVETWRAQLLEQKAALTEFLQQYPHADSQRLRQLIRDTVNEKNTGKPAGANRALFRFLRELLMPSRS